MKLYISFHTGISRLCIIFLGVSFTPREEGEHLVTVKKNGQVIPKSPFRVKVDKSQVSVVFYCLVTDIHLIAVNDTQHIVGWKCVESYC